MKALTKRLLSIVTVEVCIQIYTKTKKQRVSFLAFVTVWLLKIHSQGNRQKTSCSFVKASSTLLWKEALSVMKALEDYNMVLDILSPFLSNSPFSFNTLWWSIHLCKNLAKVGSYSGCSTTQCYLYSSMHGDMQNETVQLSYFIFKEILDFKVKTIQPAVIKDKGFSYL